MLIEFLPIDRNAAIGTDDSAGCTTRTVVGVGHHAHTVSFSVDFGRECQDIAWTGGDTYAATFATFLVNDNCSFDFSHIVVSTLDS